MSNLPAIEVLDLHKAFDVSTQRVHTRIMKQEHTHIPCTLSIGC